MLREEIVSVIIPAFNAGRFIEGTIESVKDLKAVGEIIIVEDGSTDDTYAICLRLSQAVRKIKLFTHPGRVNRGEAASRNLGISQAKLPFVSFLDADDKYYSNRFDKDIVLFDLHSDIEAVYSKTALKFMETGDFLGFGGEYLKKDSPAEFFKEALEKGYFLFDVNGVTFKRESLLKNKLFDERLALHADTELWWRLLRKLRFEPGETDFPVAVAIRHSKNSINKKNRLSELKLIVVYMDNVGLMNLADFEKRFLIYKISRIFSNPIKSHGIRKVVLHGIQLLVLPFSNLFLSGFYRWGQSRFELKA